MKKRILLLALCAAALFALAGCAMVGVDELYSLPRASKEYLQLQELIAAETAAGSEYAAPTVGSLRQSIQLVDLDKDGDNEVLAFLRNKNLQPEICIYRKVGESYEAAIRLVGDGSTVGRVEYEDFDGDGVLDILVSWEVNAEMRLLKVYSIHDWNSAVLLTASCIDFLPGDVDANGKTELFVLNLDDSGGKVSLYTVDARNEVLESTAKASASLQTANRFRLASIAGGVPAVFLEGEFLVEDSSYLLTDIFVCTGDELKNIMLEGSPGDSLAQRRYPIYCTDIDGNGSLDVPFPERMQGAAASEYYIFDWYTFAADGGRVKSASTYHSFTDGWFFALPEDWRSQISIRKESKLPGERAVIFSLASGERGETRTLLTIYILTDENRTERARMDGRFVIESSGSVVYAAKLADAEADEAARQEVIDRFHLITSEFNTGTL